MKYANTATPAQVAGMIEFFVLGAPKPQPRPRAFARKLGNGQYAARVFDNGTAEGWKSQIALYARPYIPTPPLTGPLMLEIVLWLPRPQAHYRTGKHADTLRPDAPDHCDKKPDFDNYAKAAADALTQIGIWKDDGQIADARVIKRYTNSNPGAEFRIGPVNLSSPHSNGATNGR